MKLRDWRKGQGLPLDEVASRIGVAVATLGAYENGTRRPRAPTARKIEAVTQGAVTAASLLGIEEATQRSRGVREEAVPYRPTETISVQIPVSSQQRQDLIDLGIDIDAIALAGAQKALAEAHSKAWTDRNREAIEAYNAWIDKHGTLAEQLGLI
jgi:transcriptional regulator with XRE-family HTH domain